MTRPALCCLIAVLCGLSLQPARGAEPAASSIGHNKSWIYLDPACNTQVLTSGQAWDVPVEYYLDPSEAAGAGSIEVLVVGPWIDHADGKYTTARHHVMYPDMSRSLPVRAGHHREVVRFTVPPATNQGNSLLILASFAGNTGRWPWEVRLGGIWFRRSDGFFDLETDKPGNLFTYEEPVRLAARLLGPRDQGQRKVLKYKVYDVKKATVAQGEVPFTVTGGGQSVTIPLDLKQRGLFLIEAEVEGWEKRQISFGRIPDVLAVTKGARTRFGLHNILLPGPRQRVEAECRIAQRLGLTACRTMVPWYSMEPGPGVFKLEPFDEPLDLARQYGIDPVLMIDSPAAWVQKDPPTNIQYAPFRFDHDAWRQFVQTAGTHFRGKLYAWEWLNEIVPGNDPTAVEDYVAFCRIGTQTAKQADPQVLTTLAGGLWPRSFRSALLSAGIAQYADVLPVHYSDGAGIRQAQGDLRAAGASLAIWDNESASVLNAWDVPRIERITDTSQPRWLLTHWTDELTAGVERIFWFGGGGDPAGNWSYLLDDHSPRPVAVTIAVLGAKLFDAKPLGAFSPAEGSQFHLFQRADRSVLIAWSARPQSVTLPIGTGPLVLTDYQGNETSLAASDNGRVAIALSPMPIFIEGADLDMVKAFVTLGIAGQDQPAQPARTTLLTGKDNRIQVSLSNPYPRPLSGQLRVEVPQGWPASEPIAFTLQPGQQRLLDVPVKLPAEVQNGEQRLAVDVRFDSPKLPQVRKDAVASVISPEMLGNLLSNGGFELPDPSGKRPANWGIGDEKATLWTASEEPREGMGQRVLRFTDTEGGYQHASNRIPLVGGQTYLYSAWVRNQRMSAGSNIDQQMKDGSSRSLYNVQVFVTPPDNPQWQLYTAHYEAPPQVATVGFTPVVQGSGWAEFDNVRVTRYEGTDFVAEACRARQAPTIDGTLEGDWVKACPIPLIGKNQLTVNDASYAWTPANLSAVAYLMWDQANLYLAVVVRDDVHHSTTTGEQTRQGDSLVIAFDPTAKGPEAGSAAFAYWLASASPGGGSGRHTIYRPPDRSAGLSSGQLLKDSSVYDMAIQQENGTCVYELRIPFTELGSIRGEIASRFGFSIQLNDNDGKGPVAHMNWGAGLSPTWQPANFGLVTLLEEPAR